MKGPSKFVWRGLQFIRGQHPRGKPAWFHRALGLAVVETRPGNFTAYARFENIYENDENGDGCATVWGVSPGPLDKYAPDHHTALDWLLLQLQREVRDPYGLSVIETCAAELIFEIEDAYKKDDHYP